MAKTQLTGCLQIAERMTDGDRDALLARIDELRAQGVQAAEAQLIAANDMLDRILAERTEFQAALREQNPELFGQDVEKSATAKPSLSTPEGRLAVAKEIADILVGGDGFKTIVEARKKIEELTGEKIVAGTQQAKVADEAIELGVVLAGREIIASGRSNGRSSKVIFDRLLGLYERQPNLSVRDSTSIRNQAYSTPMPLAWVAMVATGTDGTVFEPTAGNGALVADTPAARTVVNEINDDRAAALTGQGLMPGRFDAADHDFPEKSADRVRANPPFGRIDGKTWTIDGFETAEIDHAISLNALKSMKDDGRAVLIIGGPVAESEDGRRQTYRGKAKREFFFNLYRDYNVVDHYTVDGGLYAKQGASFPVDVIVINGRGQSSRNLPAADLPVLIKSWDELRGKLDATYDVGAKGQGETRSDQSQAGADARPGSVLEPAAVPAGRSGGSSGGRGSDAGTRSAAGSGSAVSEPGSRDGSRTDSAQPGSATGADGARDSGSVATQDRQERSDGAGQVRRDQPAGVGDVTRVRADRQDVDTERLQVKYQNFSSNKSVNTLVATNHLTAIERAFENLRARVGNIDEFVRNELQYSPEEFQKSFSAEQVEALALAIDNIQRGSGFVIGDQTGIGKGRVVAAMIRYAKLNGKTPVFVTQMPDLYGDMMRDLNDIGMGDTRPLMTNNNASVPLDAEALAWFSEKQAIQTQMADLQDEIDRLATDELGDKLAGKSSEERKRMVAEAGKASQNPEIKSLRDEIRDLRTSIPERRGKFLETPAIEDHENSLRAAVQANSIGDYDVIFTTYNQMAPLDSGRPRRDPVTGRMVNSPTKFGYRNTFLEHFVNQNAMLILDESHNAGAAGDGKFPKLGDIVRGMINNAGSVFYSSATFAKEPRVMDAYSKTDIGKAFESSGKLIETVNNVPMQQILSAMLVNAGQYLRRERSFDGIEYAINNVDVDTTASENVSNAMRLVVEFDRVKKDAIRSIQSDLDLEGALASDGGNATARVDATNFTSVMHNVVGTFLLSLKSKQAADEAIAAIRSGEKPVLTVANTMEMFISEYAAQAGIGVGDRLNATFADVLGRYLEKTRTISIKYPDGSAVKRYLSDAELGEDGVAAYEAARQFINEMELDIPLSPIDAIKQRIEAAGFSIGEITGRQTVVDKDGVLRPRNKAEMNTAGKKNTIAKFNEGQLDALIINRSGSTGLSMHASEKFADQRRRVMIIAQAELDINNHMQMLGRVNRTGQITENGVAPAGVVSVFGLPRYVQLTANVPIELRPAAVLSAKMANLNANTTAGRGSAVEDRNAPDFMNKYGDAIAAELVGNNPALNAKLGFPVTFDEDGAPKKEGAMAKVTGRVGLLTLKEQSDLYDQLISEYKDLIAQHDALGTNDLEAKTYPLDAETIKTTVAMPADAGDPSPFTAEVRAETVSIKKLGKPYSSEKVRELVAAGLGGKDAKALRDETVRSVRKAIEEESAKVPAGETDEDEAKNQRLRMAMFDAGVRFEQNLPTIGQGYILKTDNGNIYGVVTEIERKGKSKSPAALGAWKVKFAVVDGARSMSFSMLQLTRDQSSNTPGTIILEPTDTMAVVNAERTGFDRVPIMEAFDRGQTDSRETRVMMTGNILRGWESFKGRLLNYTNKQGDILQGILMPPGFDLSKALNARQPVFKDPAKIAEHLNNGGELVDKQTGGKNVRIYFKDGDLRVEVPRGGIGKRIVKHKDAPYFVSAGNKMRAEFPSGTDSPAMGRLLTILRTDFSADVSLVAPARQDPDFAANDDYTARNEAVQPDTSADARASIGELERVLDNSGRGYTARADGPYRAVRLPDHDALGAIAQAFGSRLVGFDVPDARLKDRYQRFNGVTFETKTGPVIYLRAGTTRPHLSLLGHEIGHRLRAQRPDLYAQLVSALQPYIKQKNYGEFAQTAIAKTARTAEGVQEEFIGEVLGDGMMNPDFWQAVGKKNRRLLERFADVVAKMIRQAMQALGYQPRTAQYVTDFRRVMEIAGEVMGEFGLDPRGVQDMVNTAPLFAAGNQTDSAPKLYVDVPNEDWLRSNQQYAKEKGRNRWGVPFMGKITASFRGEPIQVPMSVLQSLKGQRNEQDNVRQESLDYIRENWSEVSQNPPYIEVAYNGEAWINEGNHRIMVAAEMGLQTLPVEIRYFDGGERADGPLKPEKILDSADPKFAANDDPTEPTTATTRAQRSILNLFANKEPSLKTFNAYDRTLSTQYNKALKDKDFGRVFALANAMQNEVSLTSIRPAELAPGVLPKVNDIGSAVRTLVKGRGGDKDIQKAGQAIFAGTLAGDSVLEGVVWSDDELRTRFQMTDTQIGLYKQSRAAIDASIDELAAAEAWAVAQSYVPKAARRAVIDNPQQANRVLFGQIGQKMRMLNAAIQAAVASNNYTQQQSLEAALAEYQDTADRLAKIFGMARDLKNAGYAPLMRFGKYTVTVYATDPDTGNLLRDDKGETVTLFFGKYETQAEAQEKRREMEAQYVGEDVRIEAGVDNDIKHELYAGISPETLALFGEALGAEEVTRTFYKQALSERSAMKRRLQRKGIEGYNIELPRVLSSFITSNGRQAAQRYYMRDLTSAIKFIPKTKGDVQKEAQRLRDFVMNPNDPAAPVSSVMFAWYLGGSVAAAVVNLTQPVMMTAPYLSQYGVKNATAGISKALPYALGKKQITDIRLREGLKRASREGIVEAQEIFHLYSIGAQNVASGLASALSKLPVVGNKVKSAGADVRARTNAFLTLWGSMFALAESFNRKLTFIAAWDVAVSTGQSDPYAFAVRAVNETQGIYNKVNRPNWARGAVGRTVLTFKQYSLMYVELVNRMIRRGGPQGRRAAMMMLAVLMLASGEEGLPFSQDLDDLIDTIGQLLGYDTNMRRTKRRLARQILGEAMGDLFLYGVSSKLPLDFSGRLGLGNLIPGTGAFKPSNENSRAREAIEAIGPAAGLLGQAVDAIDAAYEGNTGKAAQNLAPKAVKDAAAAVEMGAKGYATDTRGRKVVDVTMADAVVKGVGFNPTKVAQENRKTGPVQQDIALQKRVESAIVEQWTRGIIDGDKAKTAEARNRLDEWNRTNPDTRIAITPDQIRDRVKSMRSDKDSRLIRTAPREMRGRVAKELGD